MTNQTATALLQARLAGQLTACSPLPSTEDDAYAIQQAIVAASDDTISGFKIGATNSKTQAILGLDQPFFGPVFSHDVIAYEDDQHNAQAPLIAAYPVKIETEFVVGLNAVLTGSPGSLSMDEVMSAIDWIAPGFEIIGSRISNPPDQPGLCAIADGGGNHSVVLGKPDFNWKDRDWKTRRATLSINDVQVADGHSGDSIAGSPIGMLHWLLNLERFAGQQITAGQFVFCGTCTAPIEIKAGDQLQGDYGELGVLRVSCTG